MFYCGTHKFSFIYLTFPPLLMRVCGISFMPYTFCTKRAPHPLLCHRSGSIRQLLVRDYAYKAKPIYKKPLAELVDTWSANNSANGLCKTTADGLTCANAATH